MTRFDLNPYAPAVPRDPRAESADDAIHFSGVVQWSDIERFGRNGIGSYVGILACSTTGVLNLVVFWLLSPTVNAVLDWRDQWMSYLPIELLLLAAFIMHVAVSMGVTTQIAGYLYARSSITAEPDLLGPLSGILRADSIELVYPHARKLLTLGAISELRRSPGGIGLILGKDWMSLVLLPLHLFEEREFVKARDRLRAAIRSSQPLASPSSDENRSPPGEPQWQSLTAKPDDADAFASGVLLSDCQWTPAYREQVAQLYGLYGCVLLNVMIAMPITVFARINVMRWHVFGVVICMVGLFLLVYIAVAFWRFWTIKSSTLAHVSGWISSEGLTINSPLGSTTYDPAAFERVISTGRSVQLILPGQHQQTLVLSKPMFGSTGGFARLRLWASS